MLTRLVGRDTQVFDGRVEKVGSVGKTSPMLFTSNQIKQGMIHTLVGDWSMYANAMRDNTHKKIGEVGGPEVVANRVVQFLDAFTEFNDQWREVRDDAGSRRGGYSRVPGSTTYTSPGLAYSLICGVAHSILGADPADWASGDLSDEQRELVEGFASIDWSEEQSTSGRATSWGIKATLLLISQRWCWPWPG